MELNPKPLPGALAPEAFTASLRWILVATLTGLGVENARKCAEARRVPQVNVSERFARCLGAARTASASAWCVFRCHANTIF
jgi:hypothetical protein